MTPEQIKQAIINHLRENPMIDTVDIVTAIGLRADIVLTQLEVLKADEIVLWDNQGRMLTSRHWLAGESLC